MRAGDGKQLCNSMWPNVKLEILAVANYILRFVLKSEVCKFNVCNLLTQYCPCVTCRKFL